MLARIRQHFWERRKSQSMRNIRKELAFWGRSTADVTDEQLEHMVLNSARLLAKAGFTTEDAVEALRR